MRRWTWICAWLLPLWLAPSAGLEAQAGVPDDVLRRPARSLALNVGGGLEIGYWTRLSDRMDVGLEIGARGDWADREDAEQEQVFISAGPALKRYMATRGPLAPYGFLGLRAGYGRAEISPQGSEQRTYNLTGQGGIGLDWFPVHGVSVGGHVGIAAGYGSIRHELTIFPGAREVTEVDNIFAQTFNSGLRVHLYF